MRRVFAVLGVLLAIPLILFLIWDAQTRALANTLLTDFTAARKFVIKRDPPPSAPKHDNGYQCLAGMLDVTAPKFLEPFSGKNLEPLEPFISGVRPMAELPPETKQAMVTFSPWAASMRECSESMQLSWVDGFAPWSSGPRPTRLNEAMPAMIDFTALELRQLMIDSQPEVALERCTTTLALAADQSHLGFRGAKHARRAIKRLAAPCAAALAVLPPEAAPVKAQLGKQWAAVRKRLATPKELMEAERLSGAIHNFAWVSDLDLRNQLVGVGVPVETNFKAKIEAGRKWRAWDAAVRKLIALADTPGAERQSASDAVDAVMPSQYGDQLTDYEQGEAELDALAASAGK